MGFFDPTDIESVLQKAPTPPAATPSGVAAPATLSVLQKAPTPPTAGPSGVSVPSPSGPPLPIQTQPSARGATAQLVPVPAPSPVIAPTTTTPLVINGVASAPQTPQSTQPGTLTQS